MKNTHKIYLGIILLSMLSTLNIYAQDEITDETNSLPIEESTIYEESSIDEQSQAKVSVNFQTYIPYITFVNYQYQGDGSIFDLQDIIMEYTPDNQGIFQIASFTGETATAYVYQMTEKGLYELAKFDNYNMVEDLRYTAAAQDEVKSLIFPSELVVGETYQSGYSNEIQKEIVDVLSTFDIGGMTFNQVLVIKVNASQQNGPLYYYYAPEYGLILIEKDLGQERLKVVQLISTQGSIAE